MTVFELVFGARPEPFPTLSEPPSGVHWRYIRARTGRPVSAELAKHSGALKSGRGQLRYRAGRDYIVEREDGERFVVNREIFERTYRELPDGHYEKRTDVTYRYFTLSRDVIIDTPEGRQRAEAGDWIMQGVLGELWPITPEKARENYQPASD